MAERDELLISTLENVQALADEKQALNLTLKKGTFSIAEARFGSRWNKINRNSFPPLIEPTLKVVLQPGSGDSPAHWALHRESSPAPSSSPVQADEDEASGLRKRNTSKNKDGDDVKHAKASLSKSPHSPSRTKVDNTDPKRDPLGWFGLPPPALKRSQHAFREAMSRIPQLARISLTIQQQIQQYQSQNNPDNVTEETKQRE